MKISLNLNFKDKSVGGPFYSLLVGRFVNFQPYSFTKGYKGSRWDEKKHIPLLTQTQPGEHVSFSDLNSNIFSSTRTGSKTPHQSIRITQEKSVFFPTNAEIEEVIVNSKDFTSAYLYHYEYTLVQSSLSESVFSHQNIPDEILETLQNVPHRYGVFDDKQYDVRFNPGREVLIGSTWLLASWKMWLGQPFFQIVSKDKILKFPYAKEIRELTSGEVYIQLFEKVEESHTVENRFIQSKWQEWIDFDTLEQRYP